MKGHELHSTDYFEHRIAERGITRDQVNEAFDHAEERVLQANGRIQVFGRIAGYRHYLRIVLLPDGVTLLNALFDENYTRKKRRQR